MPIASRDSERAEIGVFGLSEVVAALIPDGPPEPGARISGACLLFKRAAGEGQVVGKGTFGRRGETGKR
jgi:hypothetical protein